MECGHDDGAVMGTCVICGDAVCGECFQPLFDKMICGNHENLEDEGEWEIIGVYMSEAVMEDRRFFLSEEGITAIAVETAEETIELYVPVDDRDDAHAALSAPSEDTVHCPGCKIFYSLEADVCPLCGVREVENESSE